jgi:hypothetical protein
VIDNMYARDMVVGQHYCTREMVQFGEGAEPVPVVGLYRTVRHHCSIGIVECVNSAGRPCALPGDLEVYDVDVIEIAYHVPALNAWYTETSQKSARHLAARRPPLPKIRPASRRPPPAAPKNPPGISPPAARRRGGPPRA